MRERKECVLACPLLWMGLGKSREFAKAEAGAAGPPVATAVSDPMPCANAR